MLNQNKSCYIISSVSYKHLQYGTTVLSCLVLRHTVSYERLKKEAMHYVWLCRTPRCVENLTLQALQCNNMSLQPQVTFVVPWSAAQFLSVSCHKRGLSLFLDRNVKKTLRNRNIRWSLTAQSDQVCLCDHWWIYCQFRWRNSRKIKHMSD